MVSFPGGEAGRPTSVRDIFAREASIQLWFDHLVECFHAVNVSDVHPDDLLAGEAGAILINWIDPFIPVIPSNDRHAVRHRLEYLVQIRLTAPQGVFGSLSVGDVDNDCTEEGRCVVCRWNGKCGDVGPYSPAVLAPVALLLPSDSAGIKPLLRRCPVVFVSYIQRRKLSQFVPGISGDPLKCGVRRQIGAALGIEHRDADRGGFEHRAPTLFARAQRRFGAFAIADVYVNRLQKGFGGFGCRHRCRRDVKPHWAAVFFQVPLFDVILLL